MDLLSVCKSSLQHAVYQKSNIYRSISSAIRSLLKWTRNASGIPSSGCCWGASSSGQGGCRSYFQIRSNTEKLKWLAALGGILSNQETTRFTIKAAVWTLGPGRRCLRRLMLSGMALCAKIHSSLSNKFLISWSLHHIPSQVICAFFGFVHLSKILEVNR